ncbi:enolase C-terminal domain-like protein [Labrys sedimenti]|uniref:enolase C-terminal domain-like protein n=1 Tax=Labrys sedimenti TaxID=3106036 RepID=UPI002ACA47B3|nr:enolase C-terminal domain-like protein [Labrys sp. ZIDIC5]MDZ5450317.1 enolase C-terminal domain-like protein [Labrys sp. ZIDIC5]
MRILDIRERSIPISRYAGPAQPGGLTTSIVAILTDITRAGRPLTGYGYASVGRYAQSGLIRERFAPRLRQAPADALLGEDGSLDPFRAWQVMMAGEKPGGHGERCIAVGALDMALWDIAAKTTGQPLHAHLADRLGSAPAGSGRVRVYAGGGYLHPHNDLAMLADEMRRFTDLGFVNAKMKIGSAGLDQDFRRIEVAATALGSSGRLAVDAMNAYDRPGSLEAAARLSPLGLRWFEDICDPLDLATQSTLASAYAPPIGAGEALFSAAEARLLARHGGLRPDRDVLLFDPVHCYGLPGYLQIIEAMTAMGWARQAFWPHGGHLFGLHLAAALGLGGAEVTPFAFHPFSGLANDCVIAEGYASLPQAEGIGFEANTALKQLFGALAA